MLAPLGAALPFSTEVRSKTCADVRRPPPSSSAILFVMTHACMSRKPPAKLMAPPFFRARFILKVQAYMSSYVQLMTAPPMPKFKKSECTSCTQSANARCEVWEVKIAARFGLRSGSRRAAVGSQDLPLQPGCSRSGTRAASDGRGFRSHRPTAHTTMYGLSQRCDSDRVCWGATMVQQV